MMVALYGPLSLVAMGVLFCWEIDGVQVLVIDSTQVCWTAEHSAAYMFAWTFLLALTIGCPIAMWSASATFYSSVNDHASTRAHAKDMAKARHHSAWKTMKKKQRKHATDQ